MTKEIIVEVKDLHFRYKDGTHALKGVSLNVPKGSRTALLGPNGAGKSTLLLHLNGINLPQQGSVAINGLSVDIQNEKKIRTKVGLVFQDPDDQVFAMTVWDDVAFGPLNMELDRGLVQKRVEEALHSVGMWEFREKAPHHLSFGQKKRVAIAGVLAMDPEVIILDEPTAYLDPRGQEVLLDILQEFHRKGKTVILATHDMDLAAEWADRIIVIKGGTTLAEGGTELLVDQAVISEASLRLPIVAQIFSRVGYNKGSVPSTIEEAVQIIRQALDEN